MAAWNLRWSLLLPMLLLLLSWSVSDAGSVG
jgi:hypothetical protein